MGVIFTVNLMASMSNEPKAKTRVRVNNPSSFSSIHSDVTTPPGVDYCDWIRICREKLLQRENKLMNIRVQRVHCIIHRQLPKYQIPHQILNSVLNEMKTAVHDWQGISLPKRKTLEPYKTFTEY